MPNGNNVRFAKGVHQPDTLDNRILRELGSPKSLQWNVRESYASIAKRIGVDEETVRKRIRRQEKLGAIQGWRVMIHPNLIGCVDVSVDLEVGDVERKAEILSQLKLLDGVIVINNFEGKGLFVFLYAEPGETLSRKVQLIHAVCGSEKLTASNSYFPPCDLELSGTDWKIVWSMRDDPRKSISQIAKEAGVTTRTINRRLALLMERRAFFLMGLPNFRRTAGTSGNFLIYCSDDGLKSTIAEKIVSRFENTAFGVSTSPYLMYNIVFHNLSEAEEANEWIKKLEGVGEVRMRIMKDLIFVRDWLDDRMEKCLSEAQ